MDESSRHPQSRRALAVYFGWTLFGLLLLGVFISGLVTPFELKFYMFVAASWLLTMMFYPLWWLDIPTMSWIGGTLYLVFALHGALRRWSQRRSGLPARPFAAPPTSPWLTSLAKKNSAVRFTAASMRLIGPTILWMYGVALAFLLIVMMSYAIVEIGGSFGLFLFWLLLAVSVYVRPLRKALHRYPYYFVWMMDRRMRNALERMRTVTPPPHRTGSAAP